jgi:hypothetical protein
VLLSAGNAHVELRNAAGRVLRGAGRGQTIDSAKLGRTPAVGGRS